MFSKTRNNKPSEEKKILNLDINTVHKIENMEDHVSSNAEFHSNDIGENHNHLVSSHVSDNITDDIQHNVDKMASNNNVITEGDAENNADNISSIIDIRAAGSAEDTGDKIKCGTAGNVEHTDGIATLRISVNNLVDVEDTGDKNNIRAADNIEQTGNKIKVRTEDNLDKSDGQMLPSAQNVEHYLGHVLTSAHSAEHSDDQMLPNVHNVEHSDGQMLPNVHNVEHIDDQMLPNVHNVVHSDGQMLPRVHNVEHSDGQMLPNVHNVEHSDGQMLPNAHSVENSDGQMLPNVHNVEQSDGQMLSNVHNVEHSDDQMLPNVHNVVHSDGQMLPSAHNIEPTDGQVLTSAHSAEHSDDQMLPSAHKVEPTDGQVLTSAHSAEHSDDQMLPSTNKIPTEEATLNNPVFLPSARTVEGPTTSSLEIQGQTKTGTLEYTDTSDVSESTTLQSSSDQCPTCQSQERLVSLPEEYNNYPFSTCIQLLEKITVKFTVSGSTTRTCTGFLSSYNMPSWVSMYENSGTKKQDTSSTVKSQITAELGNVQDMERMSMSSIKSDLIDTFYQMQLPPDVISQVTEYFLFQIYERAVQALSSPTDHLETQTFKQIVKQIVLSMVPNTDSRAPYLGNFSAAVEDACILLLGTENTDVVGDTETDNTNVSGDKRKDNNDALGEIGTGNADVHAEKRTDNIDVHGEKDTGSTDVTGEIGIDKNDVAGENGTDNIDVSRENGTDNSEVQEDKETDNTNVPEESQTDSINVLGDISTDNTHMHGDTKTSNTTVFKYDVSIKIDNQTENTRVPGYTQIINQNVPGNTKKANTEVPAYTNTTYTDVLECSQIINADVPVDTTLATINVRGYTQTEKRGVSRDTQPANTTIAANNDIVLLKVQCQDPCSCMECLKEPTSPKRGYLIPIITDKLAVRNEAEAKQTVVELETDTGIVSLVGHALEDIGQVCDQICLHCITHDEKVKDYIENLVLVFHEMFVSLRFESWHPPIAVVCSYPHGHNKIVTFGQWTDRHYDRCFESPLLKYVIYKYTTPTCPGSLGAPVLVLGNQEAPCALRNELQCHRGTDATGLGCSGVGLALDIS